MRVKSPRFWLVGVAAALIAGGVVVLVFRNDVFEGLLLWAERNLSSDGDIAPRVQEEVRALIGVGALGLMALGLGFLTLGLVGVERETISRALLTDPAFPQFDRGAMVRVVLWVSSLGGSVMALLFLCRFAWGISGSYREDHVAEYLSALGFLVAGILLVRPAMTLRATASADAGARWLRWAQYSFVLLAVGLVFIAGEEISWGQRVFGWATPEAVAAVNRQHETNLHNLLSGGQLTTIAWGLAVLVPLHVWSMLLPFRSSRATLASLILPHPSLTFLGLLVAISGFLPEMRGELQEELLAFYALLFGLRLFVGLAHPAWSPRPASTTKGTNLVEPAAVLVRRSARHGQQVSTLSSPK